MTDRWTAETEELVAQTLAEHRATLLGLGDLAAAWSCSCGADGYGVRRFAIAEGERHQGVSILTALADAGLLPAPGPGPVMGLTSAP